MTESARISVSVCHARAQEVWRHEVQLPAGSTVEDAIAASGFRAAHPDSDPYAHGVAVYGALRAAEHVLEDQDRVDVLRALTFDPMESRRRRAAHRQMQRQRAVDRR